MESPAPSHRKGHKPSSSFGSLYEVLADLDDNQLQYLIQEMNHTGHQNVPVSKAVSAFETKTPDSLSSLRRMSMMPAAQPVSASDASSPAVPGLGVQRQLSKSQRGQLRLQSAFQRSPSLRQRSRPESPATHQPLYSSPLKTPEPQSLTQPLSPRPEQKPSPSPEPRPAQQSDKRASDFSLFDFGFSGNGSRDSVAQPKTEPEVAPEVRPVRRTDTIDFQPPQKRDTFGNQPNDPAFDFGFAGDVPSLPDEPGDRRPSYASFTTFAGGDARRPSYASDARRPSCASEVRRPSEPDVPVPVPRGRPEGLAVETGSLQPPKNRSRTKSVAYKRIPRPDFSLPDGVTVTDLLMLLELEYQSSTTQQPLLRTPSFSSIPSSNHLSPVSLPLPRPNSARRAMTQTPSWPGSRPLRRHSSRLDMMLDAERNASGAEEIGLGMLEPRPRASSSVGTRSISLGNSVATTPILSMDSFSFDKPIRADTTPPVMEGIFDVLENQ
ncbi:hypothetical protein CGCSCA1_v007683 [Colletotrichum siamense]|nr:hypothetical protein CGCSCA1_v007683 [Colletotrichum siamense]KAI8242397.1 hypothetical protein K4K55_010586 [Colletotrichum sp. SAR 10_96]KAI8266039.1 hypothetical protein K4K56_004963 [Colletotrichum sp. SAR 10_98]KAJ3959606.1 hypothetical protein N0V92_003760 [Colletotrichum tropicale]